MSNKITIQAFIDEVGRKRFEEAINVSTQLVTRALSDELFPAHWFLAVRNWCWANKIDVPEHLFRWSHKTAKPSGSIKHGDTDPKLQDNANTAAPTT